MKHRWKNGDACLRCGLRREGAGAGPYGAMRYYRDEQKGVDYKAGPCVQRPKVCITRWNIGARPEPPERLPRRFHAGERVCVISMSRLFRHFGSVVTGNESTCKKIMVRLEEDGERYWLPSADLSPANEGNGR